MATWRITDRWLAVGLLAVIYVGGRIISWQIKEGEKLLDEDAARRSKQRTAKEIDRKSNRPKEKTEDDVPLDDLARLVNDPDWEIRQAAISIVLHRFAANPQCMGNFSQSLKDKTADPIERAQAVTLQQYARNFDLFLEPRGPAYSVLGEDGNLRPDTGASTPASLSTPSSHRRFFAGSPPRRFLTDSPPRTPVVESTESDTHQLPAAPDDSNADEHMAIFRELPMEVGSLIDLADYGPLPDRPAHRRARREAIAIGTPDNRIEIYEPRSDLNFRHRGQVTAEELDDHVQNLDDDVRGMESQIQTLLSMLHDAGTDFDD